MWYDLHGATYAGMETGRFVVVEHSSQELKQRDERVDTGESGSFSTTPVVFLEKRWCKGELKVYNVFLISHAFIHKIQYYLIIFIIFNMKNFWKRSRSLYQFVFR